MPRQNKLAAILSEGKSLSVQNTAGAWLEIPGFMDWTISGGEAAGRSTGTDSNRPHGAVGNLQAPTIEATFKVVPSPAWDFIQSALESKDILSWRFETAGETLFQADSTGQAAITGGTGADAGAVTFTDTATPPVKPTLDDLALGAYVTLGTEGFRISSVNTSTLVTTVDPAPASAISGAGYSIETPRLRQSFRAKVTQCPETQFGVASAAEKEGTLGLQCISVMRAPVRVSA